MLDTGVFVQLNTVAERGDKPERAQAFSAHMENGRVKWNMDAPWYAQAFAELTRFPAGTTDDVADAMSLIGLTIDKLSRGRDPAPPPPPMKVFTTQQRPASTEGQVRATWRGCNVESSQENTGNAKRPRPSAIALNDGGTNEMAEVESNSESWQRVDADLSMVADQQIPPANFVRHCAARARRDRANQMMRTR